MNIVGPHVDVPQDGFLAVYARSAERHTVWAREFALVGDFESALEELRDLYAVATEAAPSSE